MSRPWSIALLPVVLGGCLALTSHDDPWPCRDNSDCQQGERCGQVHGTTACVDALYCEGYGSCPAEWSCVDSRCQPPICTTKDPSACGGYACLSNMCWTWCDTAQQCAPGFGCSGGQCVPANCDPNTPGQCGNYVCLEKVCEVSCGWSYDCERDGACIRGECTDYPGIGTYCMTQHNCSVGVCHNNRCITPGRACDGWECGEDVGIPCGECAAPAVCDADHKCVNP